MMVLTDNVSLSKHTTESGFSALGLMVTPCGPVWGNVLRARMPPLGGDTLWAEAVAAHEGLLGETKTLIDGCTATHDPLFDFGDRITRERRWSANFRRSTTRSFVLIQRPGFSLWSAMVALAARCGV